MFGMGGSEIIVILIVALLFLGPDKLPEAAKQISKGIRDIKKQSRNLQQTIENDERIGGAIRDLKSALRGEEAPYVPPKKKVVEIATPEEEAALDAAKAEKAAAAKAAALIAPGVDPADVVAAEGVADAPPAGPAIRLSPSVGEADPEAPVVDDDAELAAMIKPASGTVAKGSSG